MACICSDGVDSEKNYLVESSAGYPTVGGPTVAWSLGLRIYPERIAPVLRKVSGNQIAQRC